MSKEGASHDNYKVTIMTAFYVMMEIKCMGNILIYVDVL